MKRIILTAIIFLIIGGAAGYFLNPIINEKPAPTDIPASVPEPGKPQESGFAPPDKKEGMTRVGIKSSEKMNPSVESTIL